jgi:pimeloyl-ACP methyl ester carboxylesterase
MQPLFEHGLTFGGYSTRVLELEGDGPPLVFFHGFSDSADTWRATMAKLGKLDRRAVAVDLPGFGKAGALKPGAVLPQLDRFGEAVLSYAAPDGGAVVAGNSLGGCLALRLAEREALELAGIVPVAPAGLDMARWLAIIERDPVVRFLLASPVPLPEFALRRAVAEVYRRIAFHSPGSVEARVIDAFTSHFADQRTVAGYLATGRALLPELKDPFRLDRITCPVLIVWGKNDAMVYPKGAQRVIDAVPGATLEVLDECGHCPQVERPERFCELLLDFPPLPLADAA